MAYGARGGGKPSARRPTKLAAAPTRASLHEAALAYLARGAASADSVRKTLERRVGNWSRRAARAGVDAEAVALDAAAARALIPAIVDRLREVGLVDDVTFAENRARRMSSSGRSRRAISVHLVQKGVDAATVRDAVTHDPDAELAAAIAFARKRRIGPFSRDELPTDRDERRAKEQKALGAMARAGFDFNVCERVLKMDREDADTRLRDRREF